MSISPLLDGIVALPVQEEPATSNGHPPELAFPAPAAAPEAPPTAHRPRPGWIVPAAIAAVGLIASGTLGYFLYATIQQRDALHQQLVSTAEALATTHEQLTAAQTDAASRRVTATYVAMEVGDAGKVQTDYQVLTSCNHYSECRTAAQQMLTDMQTFQSDRKSANVPSSLAGTDSSLGDALSAAIAADRELITGADNGDSAKVKEGFNKLDAAMLSVAKAQAALGSQLK
jgi:hypothetical protein